LQSELTGASISHARGNLGEDGPNLGGQVGLVLKQMSQSLSGIGWKAQLTQGIVGYTSRLGTSGGGWPPRTTPWTGDFFWVKGGGRPTRTTVRGGAHANQGKSKRKLGEKKIRVETKRCTWKSSGGGTVGGEKTSGPTRTAGVTKEEQNRGQRRRWDAKRGPSMGRSRRIR